MHSGIVNERSALFTWGLWEHHLPKSQPPAFFAELLKAQTTLSWPAFCALTGGTDRRGAVTELRAREEVIGEEERNCYKRRQEELLQRSG